MKEFLQNEFSDETMNDIFNRLFILKCIVDSSNVKSAELYNDINMTYKKVTAKEIVNDLKEFIDKIRGEVESVYGTIEKRADIE